MVQTQSSQPALEPTPLQPSSDAVTTDTFVLRRSGEEAVRRAAEAVNERRAAHKSTTESGADKRSRRRSRRARTTPLLTGGGLHFHYLVGAMLLVTLILVAFSDRITKKLWDFLHPVLPVGAVVGPVEPAPWWFRTEVPVLFVGFVIWLYLMPGIADKIKTALGLRKDKERLSRRRFNKI